jgi:electron transfer flavoprotein beta subunit
MAKIIVCYKWVLDEADIKINPADLSVDKSRARGKISDYDKNAIEAAVKLGQVTRDMVVALTYGDPGVKASLKDALSRGPQEGFWVNDAKANEADGYVTANVLAAAIRNIGDYRLVFCGEGAADTFAHQIGPRLGTLLDIPVISNVYALHIENDRVIATRKLEDNLETIRATLPAVVTVLPEINPAPIPGLKAVLGAGKKPTTEMKTGDLGLEVSDLTPKTAIKELRGYAMDRKNVVFGAGDAASKVSELIAQLKKEGVI